MRVVKPHLLVCAWRKVRPDVGNFKSAYQLMLRCVYYSTHSIAMVARGRACMFFITP